MAATQNIKVHQFPNSPTLQRVYTLISVELNFKHLIFLVPLFFLCDARVPFYDEVTNTAFSLQLNVSSQQAALKEQLATPRVWSFLSIKQKHPVGDYLELNVEQCCCGTRLSGGGRGSSQVAVQ